MLTYMRKNASSWIIKVLFCVIIISFIFFYGYGSKKGPREKVIATVGETDITLTAYKEAYSNMIQMYQQMYKDQFTDKLAQTLGLKEKLLEELIDRELLLQEADRRDISVGKEDIKNAIMGQPVMQQNGVFSERKYAAVLNYLKMSASDYEKRTAQDLTLQTLQNSITEAVDVSDKELRDMFLLNNEKAKIEFLSFHQKDITETVTASDEELQAYYDANKETYRVDEMAQAQYIVFDPGDIEKKMKVEPEEIEDFYETDNARFFQPEQVRARHILLKVDKAKQPEKAEAVKKEAEKLLEKIKKGADFAKLAKKHSQDEASAKNGGDLGFFKRGSMVKPFEEAAFGMQPGEVSELVETRYGYHIIKVEEKQAERTKPLAEVKDEIVSELQKENAEEEVRQLARRAFNRLFKSKDLAGYAQANGFTVKETELFSFGNGPEDKAGKDVFSKQTFSLKPGDISSAFSINKKYYLVKLLAKKESHIAALETVRDAVVVEVKKQKRARLARELAEKALAQLKQTDFDWPAVAKQFKAEVKDAEFPRAGEYIPGIGRKPELKNAAFALADGQTADSVFDIDTSFVIFRLKEKTVPDDAAFEKEKKPLRQQLLQTKKQEALKQYIQTLKTGSEIWVDQDMFAAS